MTEPAPADARPQRRWNLPSLTLSHHATSPTWLRARTLQVLLSRSPSPSHFPIHIPHSLILPDLLSRNHPSKLHSKQWPDCSSLHLSSSSSNSVRHRSSCANWFSRRFDLTRWEFLDRVGFDWELSVWLRSFMRLSFGRGIGAKCTSGYILNAYLLWSIVIRRICGTGGMVVRVLRILSVGEQLENLVWEILVCCTNCFAFT